MSPATRNHPLYARAESAAYRLHKVLLDAGCPVPFGVFREAAILAFLDEMTEAVSDADEINEMLSQG